MAHGGEEGALRLCRGLGLLPRALELGDVVVDGVETDVLAVDLERDEHQLDVDDGAVLAQATADVLSASARDRLARDLPALFGLARLEDELVDQLSDCFLGRPAEEARRSRVPARYSLVGVHDDDRDGADLDERLEVLLLAADLGVRERLAGHVHHEALDVQRLALVVLHDPSVVANEYRSPVGRDHAVLERPTVVASREGGGVLRDRLVTVVGVEDRGEELRLRPRLARVAEDLLDPRADVLGRRFRNGVVRVHTKRQLLDQLPVPSLGRALRLE